MSSQYDPDGQHDCFTFPCGGGGLRALGERRVRGASRLCDGLKTQRWGTRGIDCTGAQQSGALWARRHERKEATACGRKNLLFADWKRVAVVASKGVFVTHCCRLYGNKKGEK